MQSTADSGIATGQPGPSPKKQKTTNANEGTGRAGGSGSGQQNEKVDVIPRNFSTQSVTLHFTQRTWEEIGPEELKYIPLCASPYYMFDEAMLNQLAKFKDIWRTMEIHQPHVRLSNLMMLQDDLINQGGTPLESSIFTQACYLIVVEPKGQQEYFQFGNWNCKDKTYVPFFYNLDQYKCSDKISQLVDVKGYKDFEQLAILPAKANLQGGWNRDDEQPVLKSYQQPYFSPWPRQNVHEFSGNMAVVPKYFVPPMHSTTLMRNLDSYSFYKYGDVINIPIHTNLNGCKLLNSLQNNFILRSIDLKDTNDDTEKRFLSEFYWPSYSRPFYTRGDQFEGVQTEMRGKNFSKLKHSFLTMPPIKKASGGALIKQRCSFVMEQNISITFNISETMYGEDENKDAYDMWQLELRDAVLMRPNVYGSVRKITATGPLCQTGEMVCDNESNVCYENNFDGLLKFLVNRYSNESYTFTHQDKKYSGKYAKEGITMVPWEEVKVKWVDLNYTTTSFFTEANLKSAIFGTAFLTALWTEQDNDFYIGLTDLTINKNFIPIDIQDDSTNGWLVPAVEDDEQRKLYPEVSGQKYIDGDKRAVIHINLSRLRLILSSMVCSDKPTPTNAPAYESINRNANVFFV